MLFDTENGFYVREITFYDYMTTTVIYLTPNCNSIVCSVSDLQSTWNNKPVDLRKALHNRPCVELKNYPPRVWRTKCKRNAKNPRCAKHLGNRRINNYVNLIREMYKPYDFYAEFENKGKWI